MSKTVIQQKEEQSDAISDQIRELQAEQLQLTKDINNRYKIAEKQQSTKARNGIRKEIQDFKLSGEIAIPYEVKPESPYKSAKDIVSILTSDKAKKLALPLALLIAGGLENTQYNQYSGNFSIEGGLPFTVHDDFGIFVQYGTTINRTRYYNFPLPRFTPGNLSYGSTPDLLGLYIAHNLEGSSRLYYKDKAAIIAQLAGIDCGVRSYFNPTQRGYLENLRGLLASVQSTSEYQQLWSHNNSFESQLADKEAYSSRINPIYQITRTKR